MEVAVPKGLSTFEPSTEDVRSLVLLLTFLAVAELVPAVADWGLRPIKNFVHDSR